MHALIGEHASPAHLNAALVKVERRVSFSPALAEVFEFEPQALAAEELEWSTLSWDSWLASVGILCVVASPMLLMLMAAAGCLWQSLTPLAFPEWMLPSMPADMLPMPKVPPMPDMPNIPGLPPMLHVWNTITLTLPAWTLPSTTMFPMWHALTLPVWVLPLLPSIPSTSVAVISCVAVLLICNEMCQCVW